MNHQESQEPKDLPQTPEAQTPVARRNFIKGLVVSAAMVPAIPGFASTLKVSSDDELNWMPGWKVREMMVNKQLSPTEVALHFLKRIEKLDPLLHAYITVDEQYTLKEAQMAEKAIMRGEALGPLHGLPIPIKDLYMTKGMRTTRGCMVFKDNIPQVDELLVERLRKAGAVILGKSQTSEFASFPRTKTLLAGECRNPWNTNHITGASSGGSGAAVAAGMSPYAIGSDGGGSTRIPAAYNGVVGFQPSAGRIPAREPHSVQMASAGPMTIDVRDSALIIQALSGMDPRDPSAIERPAPDFLGHLHDGVKGLRIAWSKDWGHAKLDVDPRVSQAVAKAVHRFEDAGARVDNPTIVLDEDKAWEVFMTVNRFAYDRHGHFTDEQFQQLTPPNQHMLTQFSKMGKVNFEQQMAAMEKRADLQRWIDNIFAKHDLICTPTMGLVAPKVPEGEWDQPYTDSHYATRMGTPYTYICNVLGLPAISVPCGFIDGLPIGLQIIGPRFADTRVMAAAQTFSEIQPWMNKHPEMFL
ncbi:amidase [Aestuariicella hydrocarbonica]|uniref:Amidase n=1 Tax=Pseudomaricurvus hydrocarbonicus TaxID=1470433 RepID=A0A9E5JTM4_9GAMM|nr:amidase [Aestuariicella hydrocarbonica]NHO66627.1 amidase [Aestuariicella hydrocarbonica]